MDSTNLRPLEITLEFVRKESAADPYDFIFEPQVYLLRRGTGSYQEVPFPWSTAVDIDLASMRTNRPDGPARQRLGDLLRTALSPFWALHEPSLEQALADGRPIHITIRSAAAELFVLPWELLTIESSGLHLGRQPGVLFRYEWPNTKTAPPKPDPPLKQGRVLFAWSSAGGRASDEPIFRATVNRHIDAFEESARALGIPVDHLLTVVPRATFPEILEALRSVGPDPDRGPISVLHLLCHGGRTSSTTLTYGLALNGRDPKEKYEIIDPNTLREALDPCKGSLRLLVVCACHGADPGHMANRLGSVAQTVHRSGIPAVIAPRFPLTMQGSALLTEELYRRLVVSSTSLEEALVAARARIGERPDLIDWTSIQLYARTSDGPDHRPFVFRPYQGLLSFKREHERLFFARDAESAEVETKLRACIGAGAPRLVVVTGASGVGKSSLVQAGVVSRFLNAKDSPAGYAVLRPGSDPEGMLEDALSKRAAVASGWFLLVIDQLEEVFTHVPDPSIRERFVQKLWALSSASDSGVQLILALRIDFLGRCGEIRIKGGTRLDKIVYDDAHRVFVAQMMPDQLRRVIEEPARTVGLSFEPGLVGRMLADVGMEPGALPLLEYALERVWLHRRGSVLTQEAYERIGGVAGALQTQADQLIDSLSNEERTQARRLLVRLVVKGDASVGTRRRMPMAHVRPTSSDEAVVFDKALRVLVDERLLVQDVDAMGPTVEVAHEALIRNWRRLQDWVEQDRGKLAQLDQVESWAGNWARFHEALLIGDQLGYARRNRSAEYLSREG